MRGAEPPKGRMHDRVVMVAGGGADQGGWSNGAAAAVLYARKGGRVFVVDRDEQRAAATVELIEAEHGDATAFAADISREDDVRRMVAACVKRFGAIDVLHNNVGIVAVGDITELTEEDWSRVQSVNVTGTFLTCKHALPHLEQRDGAAIVNVGSVSGMRDVGMPMAAYAASKAAVSQLTRSIALEYASRGVRANTVVPGLVRTPLVERSLAGTYGAEGQAELMAERDRRCPMGHMGTAWDVAYASLFLASNEARYITATELVVDGGLSARAA